MVSSHHSLTSMFQFLRRTIVPITSKHHFLQNHLWLSVKFISTTSNGTSYTVSYLTDTCGFSPERASFYTKYLNFETREKPDSVIEFFKNQGFSQNQALQLMRKFPRILRSDPEKTLQPKIDFFKSKGFSDSDILKIIEGCPPILFRSLKKEIIPCFDFFNNMFQCKAKFMKTIARHAGILADLDTISAPNIKLLRDAGVPESLIVRFIEYYPRTLIASHVRFKEVLQEVKALQFNPLKLQFLVVVHIMIHINKASWARREGIYRKWGWSDDEICAAFRVHPCCMSISDDKIEAVMDFLVNKLGYEPSAIARCPAVISMSLKKRIIPRGSVILDLVSKGLLNQPSLSAIYKCDEKRFLDKFIISHEKEANELMMLYEAKLTIAS